MKVNKCGSSIYLTGIMQISCFLLHIVWTTGIYLDPVFYPKFKFGSATIVRTLPIWVRRRQVAVVTTRHQVQKRLEFCAAPERNMPGVAVGSGSSHRQTPGQRMG